MLDLIEARPAGLLALLDEELKMPNSSSKTYVAKLHIKVACRMHSINKHRQI